MIFKLLIFTTFVTTSLAAWTTAVRDLSPVGKVRYFDGLVGYTFVNSAAPTCSVRRFDPQSRTTAGPVRLVATRGANGTLAASNCRDIEFLVNPADNRTLMYTLENGFIRIRERTDIGEFLEVPGPVFAFGWGSIWRQSFLLDYNHRLLFVFSVNQIFSFDIMDPLKPVLLSSLNIPSGTGGAPHFAALTPRFLYLSMDKVGGMFNITGGNFGNRIFPGGLATNPDVLRSVFAVSNGDFVIYSSESGNENKLSLIQSSTGDLIQTYSMNNITGRARFGFVISAASSGSLFMAATRGTHSRIVLFTVNGTGLNFLGVSNSTALDHQGLHWVGDHVFACGDDRITYDTFANVTSNIPYSNTSVLNDIQRPTYGFFNNPLRSWVSNRNLSLAADANKFSLRVWDAFNNFTFIPIYLQYTVETNLAIDLILRVGDSRQLVQGTNFTVTSSVLENAQFEISSKGATEVKQLFYGLTIIATDRRNGFVSESFQVNMTGILSSTLTSSTSVSEISSSSTSSSTTTSSTSSSSTTSSTSSSSTTSSTSSSSTTSSSSSSSSSRSASSSSTTSSSSSSSSSEVYATDSNLPKELDTSTDPVYVGYIVAYAAEGFFGGLLVTLLIIACYTYYRRRSEGRQGSGAKGGNFGTSTEQLNMHTIAQSAYSPQNVAYNYNTGSQLDDTANRDPSAYHPQDQHEHEDMGYPHPFLHPGDEEYALPQDSFAKQITSDNPNNGTIMTARTNSLPGKEPANLNIPYQPNAPTLYEEGVTDSSGLETQRRSVTIQGGNFQKVAREKNATSPTNEAGGATLILDGTW